MLSRRIAAWPILWLMPSWAALRVKVTPVLGAAGATTVRVFAGGVAAGVAPVITTEVLILPPVTAASSTSPPESPAARRACRALASRTARAAMRWLICSCAALSVKVTPVLVASGSGVIGRGLGRRGRIERPVASRVRW